MSEKRVNLKQGRSVSSSDESSSRLSSRRRTRDQTTSGSSESQTDAMSTDDDENAERFVQVTQHLSDDKRRVKGIVAYKFEDELVNRVTWIHQNSGGLLCRCLKCKAYGHSADNCQDKSRIEDGKLTLPGFHQVHKSQHDLLGILYFAAGVSFPRNNPNEKIDVTTRAMLTRIEQTGRV